MKNEFVLAFNEVLEEKGLPQEVILEALKAAMVSAYRRAVNASSAQLVEADIDLETGKVSISAEKEVVDSVQDTRTEVSLNEARRFDPEAIIGGMVVVESTPRNFGRVAAQTARQVIQQRIREAEREAQSDYFGQQTGEIVSGVVQAIGPQGLTLGLDMKAEGIMPRNQQVSGERFRVHDRVRALLLEVKSTPRGPQIILSRAHRNFLRRLLENEVPEIYHGMVEIRSIAREPGHRSKVAVAALQPGVDPVGACVGIRGVRIQAIVRELNDEKIDVIEWNPDPAVYIAKALSPARVTGVYLNEFARTKTATVVVPEDQLSLAIGRDGQNARLAAKLTAWRIDIKSLPEAAADALNKLRMDEEYQQVADQEIENIRIIEAILAKKSEGRPVMPEEYQQLSQFVDRVERGILKQRLHEKQAEAERQRVAQADIPEEAFRIPIEELGISLRITTILGGGGYTSVGDLMLQMKLNPDEILALDGIGAKIFETIENALDAFEVPLEEEEVAEPAIDGAILEAEGEAAPVGAQVDVEEEAEFEPEPEISAEAEITQLEESAPVKIDEIGEELETVTEEVAAEIEQETELETETHEAELETEEPEEEEEPSTLEELFAMSPDVLKFVEPDEELEEDEYDDEGVSSRGKKKKKKKKRFVEMEYDPDQDVVLYKRKRKRETGEDWDENWDL